MRPSGIWVTERRGRLVLNGNSSAELGQMTGSTLVSPYTGQRPRVTAEAACRHTKEINVHAHGAPGINTALRVGVDSVEHATLVDAEGIRLFKERGVAIVPTLYVSPAPEPIAEPGDEAPEATDRPDRHEARVAFGEPYSPTPTTSPTCSHGSLRTA